MLTFLSFGVNNLHILANLKGENRNLSLKQNNDKIQTELILFKNKLTPREFH